MDVAYKSDIMLFFRIYFSMERRAHGQRQPADILHPQLAIGFNGRSIKSIDRVKSVAVILQISRRMFGGKNVILVPEQGLAGVLPDKLRGDTRSFANQHEVRRPQKLFSKSFLF